jgi:hypothetical protein
MVHGLAATSNTNILFDLDHNERVTNGEDVSSTQGHIEGGTAAERFQGSPG